MWRRTENVRTCSRNEGGNFSPGFLWDNNNNNNKIKQNPQTAKRKQQQQTTTIKTFCKYPSGVPNYILTKQVWEFTRVQKSFINF